jgi:hypothetical protein
MATTLINGQKRALCATCAQPLPLDGWLVRAVRDGRVDWVCSTPCQHKRPTPALRTAVVRA